MNFGFKKGHNYWLRHSAPIKSSTVKGLISGDSTSGSGTVYMLQCIINFCVFMNTQCFTWCVQEFIMRVREHTVSLQPIHRIESCVINYFSSNINLCLLLSSLVTHLLINQEDFITIYVHNSRQHYSIIL